MSIEHDFETRFQQIVEAGKRAHASNLAETERLKGRLRRFAELREREEAVMADPVNRLHRLAASRASTPGQRMALSQAVQMVLQGRPEAGGALVELGGLDFIPALAEASAPAPAIRVAIETALLERYRELPAFIAAHGGRAAFAAWCEHAEFIVPATLPETFDIYRGTMGCSPAEAATGLHWSLNFDMAALYGARFADEHLTGVIVLRARVRRDDIACFVSGTVHSELVPAVAPVSYEIVTDHEYIAEAAVRFAKRQELLLAHGWNRVGMAGDLVSQSAARATQARMTAAGVAPGTAIVA